MADDDDLFAISDSLDVRFERLNGQVPVLFIDNFYKRPDAVREAALGLDYRPPPYPYPGRLALPPGDDRGLAAVRAFAMEMANGRYLPEVPIAQAGRRLAAFSRLHIDFALVDLHPDELSPVQRLPHVDPVPVFGLVYLNREDRGGTLFFEQKADVSPDGAPAGYFTQGSPEFELCGRIEGVFNRLAIYPGFIPHSGEIVGDWIEGEARFHAPRLTQRLVFFP
jgi:hypothetical protein